MPGMPTARRQSWRKAALPTEFSASPASACLRLVRNRLRRFAGCASPTPATARTTRWGRLFIMLAGFLERHTGRIAYAWSLTFFLSAGVFIALWVYHAFVLPHPSADASAAPRPLFGLLKNFVRTFGSFFREENAATAILFMLRYRLPEAQLAKMSIPFLPRSAAQGRLGTTTEQIGFTQGATGTFIKKIKKPHTAFANKINLYIFAIELKL